MLLRRSSLLALPHVVAAFFLSAEVASAFGAPRPLRSSNGALRPQHKVGPLTDSRFRQAELVSLGGAGDDEGDLKDPNPGGLNNYGGSDDGDSGGKDENILVKIQSWLQSDAGKEDIKTYVVSLAFALTLRTLIIEPRYIPSLSMYPTFDVGDQLAVEKVSKRIRPMLRNEVVVFNPPQNFRDIMDANFGAASKRSKEALIKRIVAVEGDTVEVKNGGRLYVNGEKQDEPFTNENAEYEFGPVEVPLGNVLVLGDNRNHSLDGHIWGFLPKGNVIGRAVFVYWPPWRIGSNGLY